MRIRTRSVIILFSRAMAQGSTLIAAIILVRLVSKEVFGTYQQSILVYALIAGLLSLQLNNTLYYFLPRLQKERRREFLAQTTALLIISAVAISLTMYLGADWIARRFNNPQLSRLIQILALYPFFDRLNALIPEFMICMDRAVRAGVYTFASSAGRVAAVILTLGMGMSLESAAWAMIIVASVIATIGAVDMVVMWPGGRWRIDRSLLLEQVQYAWPLWITAVVAALSIQIGKVIISVFFDPETYAVYSCGAMDVPFLPIITASMSAAVMPDLVRLTAEHKLPQAVGIWQQTARKAGLVIFPTFALLLIIGKDLIVFMYGPQYALAAIPFVIYLFRMPFRPVVYATMFRAIGDTKPIAVSTIIALITNVGLGLPLVWIGRNSNLGLAGPAIAAFFAVLLSSAYMLVALCRKTAIPFRAILPWSELGKLLGLSAAIAVGVYLAPLPDMPLLAVLSVRAAIFAVGFVAILVSTGWLQSDEHELLLIPVRVARRLWRGNVAP